MRNVLIVDHDATGRRQLAGMLSEDYAVLEAETGEEALGIMFAQQQSLCAVFLDVNLPEMDGFEVLRHRRNHIALARIPTIVITEGHDEDTRVATIAMGANDFIAKPYHPDIVLHCLKNNIEMFEKTSSLLLLQFDGLTGLYKREGFLEAAAKMIAQHEAGYYLLACFDIESFKILNDQYGMETGDSILRHVADCLNRCAVETDGICCRVTADEFALLFPAAFVEAPVLVDLYRQATVPACINQKIRIRIGRYRVNDLSLPVNAMYDRALIASESIKGRYDIPAVAEYDDSMRAKLLREQEIVNRMDSALKAGEFEPWFQPQYNHATGAMIGAEALVRWRRDGSFISPGEFIPVFEKNGFIYEMDRYIWEAVCKQLRKWLDEGRNPLPVSVNISRRDLFHQHCVSVIDDLVKKYAIPYDLLRLEVTESAFSESSKLIVAKVDELINLGFTVEIDDFGSGYSSLNTLKDVPASILKLDMKFFDKTENSQRGGNIIESVVRMAKWLGMAVIAEGVEEVEQADYLRSIGCYYIQGYYYDRPMPLADYEARLDSRRHEQKLTRLTTLNTLDNNEFWNPKSMETLIFNSYVGGACIFEYHNGKTELLRVNEQYARELGCFMPAHYGLADQSAERLLDPENHKRLHDNISRAIQTGQQSACELILADRAGNVEYLRTTVRVIASAAERYLFYCVIVNMTEQRIAEQKRREAEEKEMESARRLSVIMENINGGVSAIRIDDDGTSRMVFNNERYFSLYGYTREQALAEQLDVMSLIVPEDFDDVMQKVRQLKRDGTPVVIDYRIRKRDGRLAYLRANAARMDDESQSDVITAVLTDITEQKELADQLQAIVDNINGGVSATFLGQERPEYIIVNDRYFEIIGYTREQFETEIASAFDLVHPDDRERVRRQFEEASRSPCKYTMEYRMIRRNGEVRYIQCNTNVIHIFGVDAPVQLAVSNDITDIHNAQQEVRSSNDRLRAVMNSAEDGITAVVMRDDSTEFLFANDRYFELIGCPRDGNRRQSLAEVMATVHPDDRDYVRAFVHAAKESDDSVTFEYRVIHADGAVFWVRASMSVTRLIGIEAPVQIAVFSDVTAQKESEEQLRFLNDSAHEILAQLDSDKAVSQTLEKLLHYFSGDRAYVIEIDEAHAVVNNTYEVCAAGVSHEQARLQNVPIVLSDYWIETLQKNAYFLLSDVAAMDDADAPLRELLLAQNIRSLIIAPLWRDGKLIGYAGIDNPGSACNQLARLIALSDYIAILLTRRDMNRQISEDALSIRQLLDDAPDGFCRMEVFADKPPAIRHVNKSFCSMLGMTMDEVMAAYGNNAYACVPLAELSAASVNVQKTIETCGQFTTTCKLRQKNGAAVWTIVSARFVRDDAGRLFLNSYYTDITQQEKTEEMRRQMLDHLPCGAALYEYDGEQITAVHLNQSYRTLVGRMPADGVSASVVDMIHPEDRLIVDQELRAAVRQKRTAACDIRILCADAAYQPFHVMANTTLLPTGRYALYVTFEPISEHKMSIQQMLPVALSTVMSASGDLSFVMGSDLHYICCSPSVAEMLQLESPRDIIGRTNYDLFEQKFADAFTEVDRKMLASGIPLVDQIEKVKAKDGRICLVRTSKYPLTDASKNVIGIYGISRDVTDQKEKESQLRLLTNSIPGGLASFLCERGVLRLLYFNDGFFRFSGYSREEYLAMMEEDPFALMASEDRAKIRALLMQMLENGTDNEIETCSYRCYTKDGDCRWMSLKAAMSVLGEEQCIFNLVQLDITDQKNIEENLRMTEQEYRFAAKHSGCTICRYNIAERSLTITSEASEQPVLSQQIADVPYSCVQNGDISPETADAYISFYESIIHGETEVKAVFEKKLSCGWRWISAHATTIFSDDGAPVAAIVSYVDTTEQQEKETVYLKWKQSLADKPADSFTFFRCDLNKKIAYDSYEGTLIHFDYADGTMATFDACTCEYAQRYVFAEDREAYLSSIRTEKLMADYANGNRHFTMDYREIVSADTVRWLRRSVELVEHPHSKGIMAYLMFEDIDKSKRAELMTLMRSQTDPLTGVLNRAAFELQVNELIHAAKPGEQHVLMMFDIDFFKGVNDVLGHKAGDQILIELTEILRASLRRSDLIGRLGGDEFMVFMTHIPADSVTIAKAERIGALLRREMEQGVRVSASIGIAVYERDGTQFETLYKKADKALYHVKNNGKDGYAFYEESFGL